MLETVVVTVSLTGELVGRLNRGARFGAECSGGSGETTRERRATCLKKDYKQRASVVKGHKRRKRYTELVSAFEVGREEVFTTQRCGYRDVDQKWL